MNRQILFTIFIFLLVITVSGCKKKEESLIEGVEEGDDGEPETGEVVEIREEEGTAETEDLEGNLVGVWEGKEKGEANIKYDWEFAFDGETFECESTLGEFYKGFVELNDQPLPHHMDLHIEESVDGEYDDMTALGIYKYSDGVLKIALNEPGDEERPTKFSTSEGARLWRLERVK